MKSIKLAMACALALGGISTMSAQEHLKSLNPDYIDNSVKPGDDFYTHVNRGWTEANPLTPEYSRYSQFDVLAEQARDRVKGIVTGLAATNPEPGTVAFKVATIYEQAMDSVRRNREGAAPIKADLKHIEDAKPEEMEDLFIWLHGNYASPFFAAGPQADLANSNEYAMYVGGGGITLGDRDYYLSDDKENVKVREAYKKLIEKEMQLAGYSKKDARRIVKNVLKIETALADSTWTREESRNIPAMYN
ncbi:MAG: M13 family metallopeptidase, partial [Muribaculaceae bacterium]|nr:M13 family metallopeptidase [Muribaculaceae bacterium]